MMPAAVHLEPASAQERRCFSPSRRSMTFSGSRLISAAVLLASVAQASVGAAKGVTLQYRLPKATIGFAVSHMITKCPDGNGQGFEMDIATGITPVYGLGDKVEINAAGNLFIDRVVKLEYHENGTLKSFNGSSTGQGGKLVAAAIKVASFAATAAVGVPVALPAAVPGAPVLTCHKWVEDALTGKLQAQSYLDALESQVVASGLTAKLAEEITIARTQVAAFDSLLTIEGTPVYWTPNANSVSFGNTASAGDLAQWFSVIPGADLSKAMHAAGYGQTQKYTLSGSFASTPTPGAVPTQAVRSLVYREPMRATVSMKPSQDFSMPDGASSADIAVAKQRYEATEQALKPKVPQMGPLMTVPFDGSGIFGSRGVSAAFAETGELTELGYTSTGGADALAGVVDAATTAATELRDAKLEAIKREIELRTKEKELRDLIAEKAPVDQ